MTSYVNELMAMVKANNPGEQEFHQAVQEVAESLVPVLESHPEYRRAKILERLVEPERVILFSVPWIDDQDQVQVHRGYRVEMNGSIGPYKGGLRFHPAATLGIMKSLALGQVFKNSLTTLPLGGGKGGSNFDPKGKSDREVMLFCHSFMSELHRHIGSHTDIPGCDIGVGGREIGFLFGKYRRIRNDSSSVLSGKGLQWGGSLLRPEATGYGVVYFAGEMLATLNQTLEGKTCLVSGSGSVAQNTIEKLVELGARVVTVSDSSGHIHDPEGLDEEKVRWLKELKFQRRGRLREFAENFPSSTYSPTDVGSLGESALWAHKADCAFPCATQNEISAQDARNLLENGVQLVCEGANMPTVPEASRLFLEGGILYGPGKAANAGGVAVAGLELAQNNMMYAWTREEVDSRLRLIMRNIHRVCLDAAEKHGTSGNYVNGANIAGFTRVADAMVDQGVV